jgi:DNA repair protein RadC
MISNILSWAEEDRPREKLLMKGKAALSDAELIAILIGSGSRELSAVDLSKLILQSVNNNLNELAKLSINDLMKFKGIGDAKAISIAAALELGRRRKESEIVKKAKIGSSADAYEAIRPYLMDLQHEQFWVLLLNRANEVIRPQQISIGGVSGNLTPSQADKDLTKKVKEGGRTLDIPVLDHLIFGDNGYFSFADEGIF